MGNTKWDDGVAEDGTHILVLILILFLILSLILILSLSLILSLVQYQAPIANADAAANMAVVY